MILHTEASGCLAIQLKLILDSYWENKAFKGKMEIVQYKAGLLNLQIIVPLHSETGLGYSN